MPVTADLARLQAAAALTKRVASFDPGGLQIGRLRLGWATGRAAMKNKGKSDKRLTIGVDLGATKIEIALVDGDGKIVQRKRHLTEARQGPAHIVRALASSIGAAIPTDVASGVIGLGIGVAGQVDTEAGIVRAAPNLGWRDFPLGRQLEAAMKLPVVVMNDVQAATYGEWL